MRRFGSTIALVPSGSRAAASTSATATGRALAGACHPLPTVVVTALAAGLAVLAGVAPARAVVLTLAVFTGQLSIGWANDSIDAVRDAAAARRDKPAATGRVPPRTVGVAAVVALIVSAALSVLLGGRAGAAAALIVVAGWAYDLGLKATVLSGLPYLVAFGALPATATLGAPSASWPPGWAVAGGALLGLAAHFANVLPDLRDDEATGVRGLPHRLGARATAVGGALILLAASVVVVLGPAGRPRPLSWAGLALAAVLSVVAAGASLRAPTRGVAFRASLTVAALDVVLFAASGSHLT